MAKPQVKKPRPHVWKSGADEKRHSMYMPWLRARAQANYRNEDWQLTFDQFAELWDQHWHERGRGPDQYCMSRHDMSGPWSIDNAFIITIREHRGMWGRMLAEQRRANNYQYKTPASPKRDTGTKYKKMVITHG